MFYPRSLSLQLLVLFSLQQCRGKTLVSGVWICAYMMLLFYIVGQNGTSKSCPVPDTLKSSCIGLGLQSFASCLCVLYRDVTPIWLNSFTDSQRYQQKTLRLIFNTVVWLIILFLNHCTLCKPNGKRVVSAELPFTSSAHLMEWPLVGWIMCCWIKNKTEKLSPHPTFLLNFLSPHQPIWWNGPLWGVSKALLN